MYKELGNGYEIQHGCQLGWDETLKHQGVGPHSGDGERVLGREGGL